MPEQEDYTVPGGLRKWPPILSPQDDKFWQWLYRELCIDAADVDTAEKVIKVYDILLKAVTDHDW